MNPKEKIESVFTKKEGIPLYYIESGSRLWKVSASDADYDVRGFHLQSKNQYYDYFKHRDVIEVKKNKFDFASFDLNKMFELLSKSNPNVFEWMRSDIIYYNVLPEWDGFKESIIQNIDLRSLFFSYLAIAKGKIERLQKAGTSNIKSLFYIVRSILSAEYLLRGKIPTLQVEKLFEEFPSNNYVAKTGKEFLEKRKESRNSISSKIPGADLILKLLYDYCKNLEKKPPANSKRRNELKEVLTQYSIILKTKYYN